MIKELFYDNRTIILQGIVLIASLAIAWFHRGLTSDCSMLSVFLFTIFSVSTMLLASILDSLLRLLTDPGSTQTVVKLPDLKNGSWLVISSKGDVFQGRTQDEALEKAQQAGIDSPMSFYAVDVSR